MFKKTLTSQNAQGCLFQSNRKLSLKWKKETNSFFCNIFKVKVRNTSECKWHSFNMVFTTKNIFLISVHAEWTKQKTSRRNYEKYRPFFNQRWFNHCVLQTAIFKLRFNCRQAIESEMSPDLQTPRLSAIEQLTKEKKREADVAKWQWINPMPWVRSILGCQTQSLLQWDVNTQV